MRVYATSPQTVDAQTVADIARVTAGQRTLEDVARWALVARPPRGFPDARRTGESGETETSNAPGFDVVVHDEYTHDVTVPWTAGGAVFLVYDTT